jgi:HEAT repeat protein
MGPVAIPQLTEALCGEYGPAVGKPLGEIGMASLPVLIEGLRKERCRFGAAVGVGVLGPQAVGAVPGLMAAATDPDAAVRRQALYALERMGPEAREAVPRAIASLSDSQETVRVQAILTLGAIGFAARPAAPALRAMLSDPDVQVRTCAQAALRAIESSPAAKPR